MIPHDILLILPSKTEYKTGNKTQCTLYSTYPKTTGHYRKYTSSFSHSAACPDPALLSDTA